MAVSEGGPVVVLGRHPGLVRELAASGRKTFVLVPPRTPIDGLVHKSGQVVSLELDALPVVEGFARRVLGPLGPGEVIHSPGSRASGETLSRVLGIPHRELGEERAPARAMTPRPGRRRRVLLIHRHSYEWLFRRGRCLAPVEDADVYLLTHPNLGAEKADAGLFAGVAVTKNWRDEDELERYCSWAIEHYGIDAVAAAHEKMLLFAARLRRKHGLTGMSPDQVLGYRDKVVMKERLADSGVRMPSYAALGDGPGRQAPGSPPLGWVVKPRLGLGAEGVQFAKTPDELRAVVAGLGAEAPRYEVEEFIDGAMLHCDSVVEGGRPVFSCVSEYVNRCADFGPGRSLGSQVVVDRPCADVLDFNERVIASLPMGAGSTHLELFRRPGGELVFCEIACRPPGGGIDNAIERAHGISIIEADLRLQSGLDSGIPGRLPRQPTPAAWIGFYPDDHVHNGIESARFKDYGVVECRNYPGAVGEHATDFAHLYILVARSASEITGQLQALTNAYART